MTKDNVQYEAPQVTDLGTLEDLTGALPTGGGANDGVHGSFKTG